MSEERKLDEIVDELYYQRWLLQRIMRQLQELHPHKPRLTELRIVFTAPGGAKRMAPTPGPVTLTTAGQVTTATVQGFDQNGNPMPAGFTMPSISYSIDDKAGAIVKAVDNGDGTATITAVANGTANLTASGTSAEGKSLSDTEPITVAIATAAPVLSSIKIAFS